jgi:diguanylate cyclase (GGDEF)-like protein
MQHSSGGEVRISLDSENSSIDNSSFRFDAFLDFMSACSRVRDFKALLMELAEYLPNHLEFGRFSLLLCDDNRQIWRIVGLQEGAFEDVSSDQVPLSEMDIVLQTLITGRPIHRTSNMCLPMESDGRLIGVLSAVSKNDTYSDIESRVLHFLADYLAGMFERLANRVVLIRSADSPASQEPDASIAGTNVVSLRMSYLAQHDALTDLPNRLLLDDRLARALALSKRYGRRLAVLFMDLDRFKEINDSLGHALGDQLLRQLSDRLVKCVRSSDTVSRIGGDEFVVLLAELERVEDAAVSAAKIISTVKAPMIIGDREVCPTLSIGIGIYPDDGDTAEVLIQKADTAMYQSKARGAGEFVFYKELGGG